MESYKETDLITVIVPVYNVKRYLQRCVDSICAQTYRNLEILLIDDGSDDGTERLAEELQKKDERITVYHKPNGGPSSARNFGLAKAKGSWIGFVDSDDYILPNMYEHLYAAVNEKKRCAAQIGRAEVDEEEKRLPDVCVPPKEPTILSTEEFIRELLLHRGDCSFCTKLIQASLLKEDRFPEGVLNEDFQLLVKLLPKLGGVVSLPWQEYYVCCRMDSNTRKNTNNRFSRVFMDIVDNADRMENLVAAAYPSLSKEAARFALYQRLDYMLHIPVVRMAASDSFYQAVKKYLRTHMLQTITNPYLKRKEKGYLLLLSLAPKAIRSIHQWKMRLRGQGKNNG